MVIGNISDWKWRPTKTVTLLSRPYRGDYLTLPWSDSSENIKYEISMEENLLWSRFLCFPWEQSHRIGPEGGRVGPPKKCSFWLT